MSVSKGGEYVENDGGRTWMADKYFIGGNSFGGGAVEIAKTEDDEIYSTERTGLFSYEIPVPTEATYEIFIHVAGRKTTMLFL